MQLYWIHSKEHEDVTKDGYVGVSENYKRRFEDHKRYNKHMSNRIKKYDATIEIIFEGSEEECLRKEFELRPIENIGWNIVPGGGKPPICKKGSKKSEMAKQLYSILRKREYISGKNPFSYYNGSASQKNMLKEKQCGKYIRTEKTKNKLILNRIGKGCGNRNSMFFEENRIKVSKSKIGRKLLIKDKIRKLEIPNTEKWNNLIILGFTPKNKGQ